MHQNQQLEHEMVLEKVDSAGIEEWYCPTCGRRFLLQWPPDFKKVILEAGDENATHSGGKGRAPVRIPLADSEKDPTLLPWLEWIEQVDFESLWGK